MRVLRGSGFILRCGLGGGWELPKRALQVEGAIFFATVGGMFAKLETKRTDGSRNCAGGRKGESYPLLVEPFVWNVVGFGIRRPSNRGLLGSGRSLSGSNSGDLQVEADWVRNYETLKLKMVGFGDLQVEDCWIGRPSI